MADPCTKFEVSSVSRCGDFTWCVKILQVVTWPWTRPFQGRFFRRQAGTCYGKSVYQVWSLGSPVMKLWTAVQNAENGVVWGWLGGIQGHGQCVYIQGHGQCFYILPFSRYSRLFVKVADLDPPHLHLAPPQGSSRSNFTEIFGTRKLESLGYRVVLFMWSYV